MKSIKSIVVNCSEEWENAPEIDETEFRKVIEALHFILLQTPRNADRMRLKDVKISEYAKVLNL